MTISLIPFNAHAIEANREFIHVESGRTHSMAIDKNGSLWAWGNNSLGELGDGTTTPRGVPKKVMDNVKSVAAGDRFTVAVKNDGTLWTWGDNRSGQTGDGTGGSSIGTGGTYDAITLLPKKVMENVKAVSAGIQSVYAIKNDDTLWAWGGNQAGEIGNGTAGFDNSQLTPVKIMEDVRAVSGGDWFTVALKNDNSLWAWGNNSDCQLGDGTVEKKYTPVKVMENISEVSAGGGFTLAVSIDGVLFSWGGNYTGALGVYTRGQIAPTPVKVMEDVKTVATGGFHSLILKRDGTLWACGNNNDGQLGDNTKESRTIPKKVRDNVQAISAGDRYSLVLDNNGGIWAWGYNGYGELGNGTTSFKVSPSKTRIDNVKDIESSMGDANRTFIKSDNTLWQWGWFEQYKGNDYGEDKMLLSDVKMTSAYIWHKLAVKNDGTLWAWGENDDGQLGDGTFDDKAEPTMVMTDVKTASAGISYSQVVKNDGTLWAMGSNWGGVLGVGGSGYYYTAKPVKVMEDVKSVEAGSWYTTFAIKNDNSLWGWGANDKGQLGYDKGDSSFIPVKIMEDVLEVSAGFEHTLVIKTDGSLWAFGDNKYGQIGNGTNEGAFIPVKIMDNVSRISAGYGYSMAIKKDGTLWAWGFNNFGQLGNGATTNKAVPVKVLDNVKDVSTCTQYTVAVKNDNTLWEWGRNKPDVFSKEFSSPVPNKVLFDNIEVGGETKSVDLIFGEKKVFKFGENNTEFNPDEVNWNIKSKDLEPSVYMEPNEVFVGRKLGTSTLEISKDDGNILRSITINVIRNYDINSDGDIDILDMASVSKQYNSNKKSSNWHESFDINGDDIVDIYDLVIVAKHFAKN